MPSHHSFDTTKLPDRPDAVAPDGSDVRVLLRLEGGSMAHFELGPGQASRAVTHRTVSEIWYVLDGRGEMWRKLGTQEDVVELGPGVCLTIPQGVSFQFRSLGHAPLSAVGVTLPPWPLDEERASHEATLVEPHWDPTVT